MWSLSQRLSDRTAPWMTSAQLDGVPLHQAVASGHAPPPLQDFRVLPERMVVLSTCPLQLAARPSFEEDVLRETVVGWTLGRAACWEERRGASVTLTPGEAFRRTGWFWRLNISGEVQRVAFEFSKGDGRMLQVVEQHLHLRGGRNNTLWGYTVIFIPSLGVG